MSGYSFPTGVDDGHQVELENGVTYEFKQEFKRWDVVKGTGSSVWITGELPDKDYVSNGDLWFDSTEDTMQLFLWHEESDAWLPVAPPTTLEGRVSTGEATQQAIIAQIEQSLDDQAKIAAKVEELAVTKGAVARYVVTDTVISGVAGRNGELYVSSSKADEVDTISFAPFDLNGQATKPCNPDDIVEFVEAAGVKNAGDVTRYKVISGTSNALTVEYLSGTNDFEVGEPEEVYIYPQNSAFATIEYVDAQDTTLSLAITQNGREIEKKLGKTDANVVNNNFRIKSDTKTYISTSGGELAVNHVKEPTSDHHAATKGYVDSKSGGIGIAPPAPLRWIWRNYDSTIDPGEGKFAWNSGSGFFRINYVTADGVNLGKSRPASKDINFDTNPIMSIWYKDGSGWKLKQTLDIYRMQWDRNDCMWFYRKSILIGDDSFTADVQYHITVGGLF